MKPPYAPIRVLLADDHEIFREGFDTLLKKQPGIELAGEATNGIELVRLAESLKPDVVLTDIQMPGMDGIAATRLLQERVPHIPVIALTMFDDDHLIVEMLEAGARGYLLKNSPKAEVFQAIHAAHRQETYYCHQTSRKLARMIADSRMRTPRPAPGVDFSEREKEVIRLVCRQFSSKEIAAQLNLSVRTIEGHREKIQEKMKARNTAGIVIFAIRSGIFPLS
jgi:two-component system, NarL family, response regulator NreC